MVKQWGEEKKKTRKRRRINVVIESSGLSEIMSWNNCEESKQEPEI